MFKRAVRRLHLRCPWSLVLLLLPLLPPAVAAQSTGTVTGSVTRAEGGAALAGVTVSVQSTGQTALSSGDGRYTLRNVPSGPQTIVFRWLGYRPAQQEVTVEPGGTVALSFVVTDTTPRWQFYLLQKRDSPLAETPGAEPGRPGESRFAHKTLTPFG